MSDPEAEPSVPRPVEEPSGAAREGTPPSSEKGPSAETPSPPSAKPAPISEKGPAPRPPRGPPPRRAPRTTATAKGGRAPGRGASTGKRNAARGRKRQRKKGRLRQLRLFFRLRWGRSWSILLANPALCVGLVLLGGFIAVGVAAPLAYPGDANQLPIDANIIWNCSESSAPTWTLSPFSLGAHPWGQTAHLGFDIAQALLLGTRWDLLLLGLVVGASVAIGTVLGGIAGTRGGWMETVLSAIFDGVLAFPPFVIVLIVMAVALVAPVGPARTEALIATLVAVLWAPFAQAVRAQSRLLARQPFVEAARATGARLPRILVRHVLPNCVAAILAQVPATIFSVLFVMGSYQYLGLTYSNGAVPPVCGRHAQFAGGYLLLPSYNFPEWTWTLANGAMGWAPPGSGLNEWWGYLVPTAWIALFLLAVTLVCDGLVDQLSPLRRRL